MYDSYNSLVSACAVGLRLIRGCKSSGPGPCSEALDSATPDVSDSSRDLESRFHPIGPLQLESS